MRQLVARYSTEDITLLKIGMAQLCNGYLAPCDSCLLHSYRRHEELLRDEIKWLLVSNTLNTTWNLNIKCFHLLWD